MKAFSICHNNLQTSHIKQATHFEQEPFKSKNFKEWKHVCGPYGTKFEPL